MMDLSLRPMSAADLDQVALLDAMSFPIAWPQGAFTKELANPQAHCARPCTRVVLPAPSSP